MDAITKGADLLMAARQTRHRLPILPDDCRPADLPTAYAIQEALAQRLVSHYGGRPVGYKIGCTNEAAQQFLNLDGPFHGPLLSAFVYDQPAKLQSSAFFMCVIEPEFAFELAEDLPPRSEPYQRDQVAEVVGTILPVIEVVDSCYDSWTTVGAPSLIADNACNGAWIKGEPVTDWRSLDLAQHQMQLIVNGTVNQTGRGEVVLGHPLNALTWLANALSQRGVGLKAGDFISTGVCVDAVYPAAPGDEIKADFGILGSVTLSLI